MADAYAAVAALTGGRADERIPLWNTVTRKILTGMGESEREPTCTLRTVVLFCFVFALPFLTF